MFRVKNNDQSNKNKNEMIGQNICKDAICKFITAYENHFLLDEAKKNCIIDDGQLLLLYIDKKT